MRELPKGYEPAQTEGRWYQFWSDHGYFKPDEKSTKPVFSMVIPPPNVTGSLHIGHALNNSLQDIMARFKRMKGFDVLWIPGQDHAGIATQMVVERLLAKEGVKREQLGREKFVERVWKWKEESGGMILGQQRRLGNSVDWSRSRFTLDEGLSKAVRKVFVELHKQGLIYQGNRLVNWCPRCLTAVSDLEVKHTESKGSLWHIRYPLSNGKGEVVVATTRPETMLGDTAVAVHPDDERYKKLVGQKIKLPLTGREIPVVADSFVAQDFGSGVVKITPAHDFNDYEMAQRQKLPMISIFDERAVVNENGGAYKGLKALDARKKVLEDLTEQGFLVKEEPHTLSIGRCDRCETIIEPRLSDQWFVKIEPLAKPAIKVVEDGQIKFFPENYTKTYLDWMYNIKDWCISRQLWWGHRIPAWHCENCKHVTVSMTDPTACEKCGDKKIKQETDVLDTWFSSALWPFSTMGWPDQTATLKRYYPTSVLVTSFDIIFFWVARMVMMGMHFMNEVPFKTVYIHALVRDERGQKMSKTKGNVVDPLGLIDDCGADALRFTMAALVGAGRDIKFSEDRLEGYRNFINKLWNATRFSLTALENVKIPAIGTKLPKADDLKLPDRYILRELENTISITTKALEEFRFTDAASALYKFTWNEFCDWYLELSKPVLYGEDQKQKENSGLVLINVLDRVLRLMHPITPFVTEEIYQILKERGYTSGESVMMQPYPVVSDELLKVGSESAAREIELVKEVVTAIRNIRGENRIGPGAKIKVRLTIDTSAKANKDALTVLKNNESFVVSLARLSDVEFITSAADTKKCAMSPVALGDIRVGVVIPLEGLVDFAEEIKRLQKEVEKTKKDLELTSKKLSTETFVKNAPPEIVEQEKQRKAQLGDKLLQLELGLQRLI